MLQALVEKTKTITRELGCLSPVLDRRLEAALKGGIDRGREEELKTAIRTAGADPQRRATVVEELDTATRAQRDRLAKQLDGLRDLLDTSRAHLDLREASFRAALDCSLELLGASPLAPAGGERGAPNGASGAAVDGGARWRFPALDRRAGADGSWTETLDTLRAPRAPGQKEWEWRSQAPIRPVMFEDAGALDADAVHLHLEHRVVKRLLGRFLAQGFVHDDLSRACVGQTRDAVPRVVLLGRLSLYGPGAARLHDEVIAVAARWTDGPCAPRRFGRTRARPRRGRWSCSRRRSPTRGSTASSRRSGRGYWRASGATWRSCGRTSRREGAGRGAGRGAAAGARGQGGEGDARDPACSSA